MPRRCSPSSGSQTGATTSRLAAMQILVAYCGRLGGLFKPHLPIRPDDGVLDVVAIRASGPLDALLAGWEAIRQRRRGRSRGGRAFRGTARAVSIRSTRPRLVEIDGTVIGSTPVDIEVRPGALVAIVPGGGAGAPGGGRGGGRGPPEDRRGGAPRPPPRLGRLVFSRGRTGGPVRAG